MSLFQSSFYWGYTVGQLPAARLIQSHGAKWIFGLSVLVPSLLTLLVPAASKSSLGLAVFVRIAIGLFESATFPCVYHFIVSWIPIREKTTIVSVIYSGMALGTIIGFALSGIFVDSRMVIDGEEVGNWPSVFYVFGMAGVLWFPLWAWRAYETPADHPSISREEIGLIAEGSLTM